MRVIVILYPDCILFEVAGAISLLGKRHRIILASPDGKPVLAGDQPVEANLSYDEVDLTEVRYVLVPGGDCSSVMNNPALNAILKNATASSDIVVGAICNGALVLANAGILSGRRCTHTAIPRYAPVPEFQELLDFAGPRFAESIYVDDDVVVDGRLVTAKPWAYELFAEKVAELGGDLTREPGDRI